MCSQALPLHGKTALVTGVSRRKGIGFATATALARLGANVFIHHYAPHDRDQPWGSDDLDALSAELTAALTPGSSMGEHNADLKDAGTIDSLLDAASQLSGTLDILVCNQAVSGSDGSIFDMTPEKLDAHWDANTRATILMTAGFARRRRQELGLSEGAEQSPGGRAAAAGTFKKPTGHVIWMTSGQQRPMRAEVAYAASKAALAGLTPTVALELLDVGLILNTINPGPVNTGYLDPETTDRDLSGLDNWLKTLPFGRLGHPTDPAQLIAWLCTDAGSWLVGQVLTSDGGASLM